MRLHEIIGLTERAAQTETPAFRRWFGNSKIVGTEGRPLVVYHGTNRDFDVFQGHGTESIYRADGEELLVAMGWDMGDDRQGMPHGYHYNALTNAMVLGADGALAQAEKQADRSNSHERPDTKRYIADLRRLAGKQVTMKRETRPNDDGFWFTPDKDYSYVRDVSNLGDGAHVKPVYLTIQNPKFVASNQIESAGRGHHVTHYREQGYDGVIYAEDPRNLARSGWNGSTQIVAFDPRQIKSAIGNGGAFDPESPRTTESAVRLARR